MALNQALALAMEMRLPFMLWGDPQIGKTERIRAIGRALGRQVFTVIASLHEPTDFTGLPSLMDVLDDNGLPTGKKMMVFFPMHVILEVVKSRSGIFFLDEASNANLDIQKALMQGIHEGRFGYIDLPPGVSKGLAGNPPESAAGGGELTAALASRVVHLEVRPDLDEYLNGQRNGWPAPVLYRLPVGWKKSLPDAINTVCGFLEKSGLAMLHAMPKAGSKELSRGWPGYRTWEMVQLIEAACNASGADDDTRKLLISGAVGPGAAAEFDTYRRDLDLPSPTDVLANPSLVKTDREDRMHRILESSMGLAKSLITTNVQNGDVRAAEAAWNAAWSVLGVLADAGRSDAAMNHGRSLMEHPAAVRNGILLFQIPIANTGSLYAKLMGDL